MTNLDSVFEKQRHYSVDKGPYSEGYGLPCGHIQLWQLNHKESRPPKNWCLWTVMLKKTSESPLDGKVINPVNLRGNEPWILTGRTKAEAETPAFWSPDANSWDTGKVPDAGKDRGQEEEEVSEDRMATWDHWHNGHELGKLRKMVRGRETWRAAVHVVMSQTQLGNWTTILYARLNTIFSSPNYIMRYLLLVFPFLKCLFWRQKEMEYLAQGYTGRGGTKLWIQ